MATVAPGTWNMTEVECGVRRIDFSFWDEKWINFNIKTQMMFPHIPTTAIWYSFCADETKAII